MKRSIQNVLVLFVVIVSIFTFINMVSVDRAEAVSCPEGLVCTPVNTAFVCPVGYTCTLAPTCPVGFTCKPKEIQSITCPSGYICKLTNNGGGSSGGNSGGGHSNGCYRFDTNLSVGSFWTQRSTGADVVALQTILMEKGFDVPSVSSKRVAKGVFDADTKAAVIKFQTSMNIPATGFVGPLTRDVLNSLCDTPSIPVDNAVSLFVDTRSSDAVSGYYQVNLSFNGGTSPKPISTWKLYIQCPSKVDVNTSPGASCNDFFEMSSIQNNGNVSSKAFWFKNYSGTTQTIKLTLTGYSGANIVGSSQATIQIPPNSSGQQTWSQVTLLNPNGGESFAVGQPMTIKWKTTNGTFQFLPSSKVKIYLTQRYPGQGGAVKAIFENLTNSGSATVTIPSDVPAGSNYKVDVMVYAEAPASVGSAQSDDSDSNFTITNSFTSSTPSPTPYSAPSAKVISPNGGETWTIGQTYLISTASNGELGTRTIKLNRYSDDSVRIGSEVIGTTNTDSFYFKVPVGTAETRYEANRYKIQVQSNRYNEGMGVADESDGYISIVSSAANPPPSVTVTSPNSGEIWSIGDRKTITWSYANWNSGIFGNKYVDMYLVPMDGRSPMKLATNFNSPDGTVHVTIYEKTSDGRNAWLPGRYKIRVVCNTNNVAPFNSCMDESDGYITVIATTPTPTPNSNPTSMNDQTSLNASIWDAIRQYYNSKASE